MQTTHSELPGPSRGLGADGVIGVPGVSGGLGIWMAEVVGGKGGEGGGGAVGMGSVSSSICLPLQTTRGGGRGKQSVDSKQTAVLHML